MIQQRKLRRNSDPSVSPFLGLFEGKSRAVKAAGEVAIETARRETLMMEQLAQLAGANVAAQKAAAESALLAAKAAAESSLAQAKAAAEASLAGAKAAAGATTTKAESNTNLYLIIGGIALVLMGGLYFIVKARRK